LIEASLVSVPANPRARRIIKQFFPGEDETSMNARSLTPAPGMNAETQKTLTTRTKSMKQVPTLDERIQRDEQKLVAMRDRLTELDAKIADRETPSEEQSAEVDAIGNEIDTLERSIATAKATEKRLKAGIAVTTQSKIGTPTIIPRLRPDIRPGDHWLRSIGCLVQAKQMQGKGISVTAQDILEQRWHGDETTAIILKAVTNPATTVTAGWAAELVETTYADFINLLPRQSLFNAVSSRGTKFSFDRSGIVKIPSRAATPKINGSFVGEGQPIPVRKAGVSAVTLTQKKMAVISTFTQELAQSSTPSIEAVIRDAIMVDTSEALDTVLIDATVADAIRPAGLRSGVGGLTPSVATLTIDKMIADLKALEAAITANRGGQNLLLMMNPAQYASFRWALTNGIWLFESINAGSLRSIPVVVSDVVPATMVIMVDAAYFTSVTGDSPQFDVSDQAVVHEEDTTPLAIGTVGSPATVAAPARSFWQTYSVGIRMILPMNWAMVRSGMVSWMTAVTW